jgi:ankyrin repeat protein
VPLPHPGQLDGVPARPWTRTRPWPCGTDLPARPFSRPPACLCSRLLRAGANVDSFDYDKRTALHVAAADGNLAAVKLLVEQGGAQVNLKDRCAAGPGQPGLPLPLPLLLLGYQGRCALRAQYLDGARAAISPLCC